MFSIKSCRNGFAMLSSLKQGAFSFFFMNGEGNKPASMHSERTSLLENASLKKTKQSSYFATRRQQKCSGVFQTCVMAEMCLAGVASRAAIHKKSTEESSEMCGVLLSPHTPQLFSMEHICPACCCNAVKVILVNLFVCGKEMILRCFFTLKCFL